MQDNVSIMLEYCCVTFIEYMFPGKKVVREY